MKYLDTSWFHEMEGKSYPLEKVRILLAFYLAWALKNGLGGDLHTIDNKLSYDKLSHGSITPLKYYQSCDDKITDEDFNKEGNSFSKEYLKELYFEDYVYALRNEVSEEELFEVDDTWENYNKLAKVIDRRFANWKSGKDLKKLWWQFWK